MISIEERMQLAALLRKAESLGVKQTSTWEFVENETTMDVIAAMYYAQTGCVPYKFNDIAGDVLIKQFTDRVGVSLDQEYPPGYQLYSRLIKWSDIYHWTFAQICAELERS